MNEQWAETIRERIKLHLFVVPINNSGSSYLTRALSTCRKAIFLRAEGQHIKGWGGPVPRDQRLSLIWGHSGSDYGSVLSNPDNYDWEHIKRTWYAAAHLRGGDDSCVFLEKSPPHVARVGMLQEHFHHPRFIFLVRNPYAIAESIGRRRPRLRRFPKVAAEHVMTCLRLQRENSQRFENSILLRYEDMCADVPTAQAAVRDFVPEFDDFQLDQKIKVKGIYDENIRDMNEDHLARLPAPALARLTEHFAKDQELLEHFGYSLIDA